MVLVTTRGFTETIEVGDPMSQARIYQAQAADELVFLDLDASAAGRLALLDLVETAAAEIFMPFTVGGGVRSLDDFTALLSSGADKVSVNTAALDTPDLVDAAAAAFGAQCVVVSIDVRRSPDGTATVWRDGARNDTGRDPVAWASEVAERGAGEILLTAADLDGSGTGLDIELTDDVASAVDIPVIASGGCGIASHFVDGYKIGGADAVAAGTYFCLRDQNPMQARSHIRNAGLPIRMET
jgi:cyclase